MLVPQMMDAMGAGCAMELAEFYLDESEAGAGRWFCVAGWMFAREGREALHEEWSELLRENGLPYFHMSDCAHAIRAFKPFGHAGCDKLQRRFFEVLKKHALVGFCATYDMNLVNLCPTAIDREGKRFHVTPYTLCCYWAFLLAKHWGDYNSYTGKIAYFYEAGHASESQANRMMGEVFSNPKLREIFRYSGHAFVDKRASCAVQTADILAWLWSKSIKDRAIGKTQPRADLVALLDAIPCASIHFDEERIRGFVKQISTYGDDKESGPISTKALETYWRGAAWRIPSYWMSRSPHGKLPH